MQLLSNICTASRDFENMLRSPIIKADKKQQIVVAILKDNISALTGGFCKAVDKQGPRGKPA